jgi:hypothetical protein
MNGSKQKNNANNSDKYPLGDTQIARLKPKVFLEIENGNEEQGTASKSHRETNDSIVWVKH